MEDKEVKCGGCPEPCTNQCGDCTKYFCACPPTSRISYAAWANEQAFWAGWMILGGSLIAIPLDLRSVPPTGYGLYTRYIMLPFALLVLLIEYQRGKKKRGTTQGRLFQEYVAPIPYFFRFLTRSLFLRSLLYTIFSVPCFLILSTNIGGMTLLISAFFYFVAAIYRENWVPPELAYGPDSKKKGTRFDNHAMEQLISAPPKDEVPTLPMTNSESGELISTS